MKKPARKKTSAKKTRSVKAAVQTKSQASKAATAGEADGKLSFDHAMVYVKDVERGLGFYRDLLGFKD